MKFQIKRLSITNFKGIRRFQVDLDPQVTNIRGANATGKTTLADAFRWLLFGKDTTDRAKFEIKTLDANNEPYHHLSHEVQATIEWQGMDIELRRVFKEKWSTKRGNKDREFIGHIQEFFWNDTPLKEGEYQARIAGIMPEGLFKLLTNPSFFNNHLTWEQRRAALQQIAGEITEDDILKTIGGDRESMALLLKELDTNGIADIARATAARKKKIREELDTIPYRIDEATRSLNQIPVHNYEDLHVMELETKAEFDRMDRELNDTSEAEKKRQLLISEKIREVYDMKGKITRLEFDITNKSQQRILERQNQIAKLKTEFRTATDKKIEFQTDLATEEKRLQGLILIRDDLRAKWNAVTAETLEFKDGDLSCPTCHRPFEGEDLESKQTLMRENFNNDKARRLEDIAARGKEAANQVATIEAKITNIKEAIKSALALIEKQTNIIAQAEVQEAIISQNEQENLKVALESDTEIQGLKEMIRLREEEIKNPPPAADEKSSLKISRDKLAQDLEDIQRRLATREIKQRILDRLKELDTLEQSLAQQLADQDKIEYQIDTWNRGKMDTLEARINGKFKLVKFKMFADQINGGKADTCTTLINGVPWEDANTAAKIHAGLDIIGTFSEYYDTYAPIWIDNRESVLTLPETKSQLINLFASAAHDKLTVDFEEPKRKKPSQGEVFAK